MSMTYNRSKEIALSDLASYRPELFWSKVDRTGQCWEWRARISRGGYGIFGTAKKYGGRQFLAHRFSYAMKNGGTPAELHVLHRCDNKLCVNPDHLFIGTHLDNMRDMAAKGRIPCRKGERNNKAKLDAWDVICIRADRRPYRLIAADYGIHNSQVSLIKTRKNWAHIPEFAV